MNINWKWPAARGNNYAPWYSIVRRFIFAGPMFVGLLILVASVFCAYGYDDARGVWRENV